MQAASPDLPPPDTTREATEERKAHEATERRAEREAVEGRKSEEAAQRDSTQEALSERGAVSQGVTEGGAANTAAEALTEGGAAWTTSRCGTATTGESVASTPTCKARRWRHRTRPAWPR